MQGLDWIFTRVTTRSRLVGVGLACTVDIRGTAIKALIEDDLTPRVPGMDARGDERIWRVTSRQSRASASASMRWRSRRSTSRSGI